MPGGIIINPIAPPLPISTSAGLYPSQTVQAFGNLIKECSAVKLARYAQIIGYDERAFFGIYWQGIPEYQCEKIWTLDMRQMVAKYLCEAQEEIEQETGYPISIKWVEDEQPYNQLLSTRYSHIVAGGIQAKSVIAGSTPINHTNDPAIVGPLPLTAVISSEEIHVFYPGTDIEIVPSKIIVDASLLTVEIEIPRARLVSAAFANNPVTGLSYTDVSVTGPYQQTVDVYRVYNDTGTQAILYKPKTCSTSCQIDQHTACIQVYQHNISSIRLVRTTSLACDCSGFSNVMLYYQAGVPLTRQAEDAIIRLAHSKMPEEACGCEILHRLWERDNKIPDTLTAERATNPFGLSDGAWIAWMFARAMKTVRGNLL